MSLHCCCDIVSLGGQSGSAGVQNSLPLVVRNVVFLSKNCSIDSRTHHALCPCASLPHVCLCLLKIPFPNCFLDPSDTYSLAFASEIMHFQKNSQKQCLKMIMAQGNIMVLVSCNSPRRSYTLIHAAFPSPLWSVLLSLFLVLPFSRLFGWCSVLHLLRGTAFPSPFRWRCSPSVFGWCYFVPSSTFL